MQKMLETKRLKELQTIKLYLDRLSFGQDPITGEDLPENELLYEEINIKAFQFMSKEISKLIKEISDKKQA